MALPKINQPLFELTVPSTGKKVKFRPFTVKEEKILLMAQESDDQEQIILAIKQIVNNCIDELDIDSLAIFDLEYILIKLRAASINNSVQFRIIDADTSEEVEVSVDLNSIEVEKDEKHSNVIELSDGMFLKMCYPRPSMMMKYAKGGKNKVDSTFDTMLDCIESIVNGEDVYKLSDYSKKEVDEFVDSLSVEHMEGIKRFFETMPSVKIPIDYTLADGTKKSRVMAGTETIFL